MTENIPCGIQQVDLGRRINNHCVTGKLCKAFQVRGAVSDKVSLPRDVHCDGRIESLRQFLVIKLRIDTSGEKKYRTHEDHDNEQGG